MTLQLDKDYDSPESIKIELTHKEELRRWIELASRCLSGSADMVMERILMNIGHLPKSRLDIYYSSEKFYFVTQNMDEIGILNFNPNAGRISNVGVDPSRRGQGYGRQIMMFGLKQLKAAGCKQASLRVHVDNKPALNMYNSLGFEVVGRRRFLIWENETT
jgi:GNAT superfamily N-acetyltransferase